VSALTLAVREPETGRYSARVLGPELAGDEARTVAVLSDPAVLWTDPRWRRFVARTDLHEVRHLVVECDGSPVAVAQLLLTRAPGGLLFYDPPRLIGTPGAMADPAGLDEGDRRRWDELVAAVPQARAGQYPTLALATFGNHLGLSHAAGRTGPQRRAALALLPTLLDRAARELGCRSTALLYADDDEAGSLGPAASALGYRPALLGTEGVLRLAADSADGYLAEIGQRRRSRLRRELREYAAAGFTTVVRHGGAALAADVVALQVAHRAKHGLPGGEERVRQDFASLAEHVGDDCVLLGAQREGALAGFVLFVRRGPVLFARTAGFAPDPPGCYLALTYHASALWASDNGIRQIHYGLAAAQAKRARGCELEPRWGWFRFTGPASGVLAELVDLQDRGLRRQWHRCRGDRP